MASTTISAVDPPVTDGDEIWRAECRECGRRTEHPDRESAHLAALEHIADSGHFGETAVSAQFRVWRCDLDDRLAARPHRLDITISVRPDGQYAM